MVNTLSRAVLFVARGNAFLAGDEESIRNIEESSVFKFSKSMIFTAGRDRSSVRFRSSEDWFDYIRSEGCRRFNLVFKKFDGNPRTYKLLGFAGAESWAIQTKLRNMTLHWHDFEEVGDRNDPDQKIWLSALAGFAPPEDKIPEMLEPHSDLGLAHETIGELYPRIIRFCESNSAEVWAPYFQKGLTALQSDDPFDVKNDDSEFNHNRLFPGWGYSLDALQVFAASASGYLFGGMGSWNDMGFPDEAQRQYESLSTELYRAVTAGIEASTNSFDPLRDA